MRSSKLLLAGALAALILVSNQASATTWPHHDYLASIARSGAAVDWFGPQVSDLSGFLPNHQYREHGVAGPPRPLSSVVVLGAVTDVGPGLAWRMPHPDGPAGIPTRWDDPNAAWRTAIVQFRVDELIAASSTAPPVRVEDRLRVSVPLWSPITIDDIRHQLTGHRYVLFLNPDTAYGSGTPPVFRIAWNDALIASVDAAGRLALPGMQDGSPLLQATGTVEALRSAAAQHDVIVTW
jgi:hypothetical protein